MNTLRLSLCVVLFAVFGLGEPGPAGVRAQEIPDLSERATPNVKEYGREGYPKITVYVWGSADTGVWKVEEGTDLLEFLSVVSRVRFGDRNPERRSVETLRMYRDQRPSGDAFFEARVQKLFADRSSYPDLQEGDILVLENQVRTRFTWRDINQVVGTVAALLNTYLLIERLR